MSLGKEHFRNGFAKKEGSRCKKKSLGLECFQTCKTRPFHASWHRFLNADSFPRDSIEQIKICKSACLTVREEVGWPWNFIGLKDRKEPLDLNRELCVHFVQLGKCKFRRRTKAGAGNKCLWWGIGKSDAQRPSSTTILVPQMFTGQNHRDAICRDPSVFHNLRQYSRSKGSKSSGLYTDVGTKYIAHLPLHAGWWIFRTIDYRFRGRFCVQRLACLHSLSWASKHRRSALPWRQGMLSGKKQ